MDPRELANDHTDRSIDHLAGFIRKHYQNSTVSQRWSEGVHDPDGIHHTSDSCLPHLSNIPKHHGNHVKNCPSARRKNKLMGSCLIQSQ